MSRGGRNAAAINARAMAEFRKRLEAVGGQFEQSARRIVTELANVGMAETVKNTPVGDYTKDLFVDTQNKRIRYASFQTKKGRATFRVKHVKIGGTLRRGWKRIAAAKSTGKISAGYANEVEYALYVNEGHRTVSKSGVTTGFVPGKHMVEIGMRAAEKALSALLSAEIDRVKKKTGF